MRTSSRERWVPFTGPVYELWGSFDVQGSLSESPLFPEEILTTIGYAEGVEEVDIVSVSRVAHTHTGTDDPVDL